MTGYAVRPAVQDDADRLGVVHTQVWREAYRDLMPAGFLASLDPVRSAQRWRQILEDAGGRAAPWVGTADDEVVGMAVAGPSRDDPPDPAHELYALNLLAAHHGTGLADRMLEAALEALAVVEPATSGDSPMAVSLWVVRDNHRARAFYQRHGFVVDGRASRHDETGVAQVRLVRACR